MTFLCSYPSRANLFKAHDSIERLSRSPKRRDKILVGMLMEHTFHWKIPGNKWNFEKVVLFSRWKLSGEKARSIYEFSQEITTSRLFTSIYICTTILNFGDQSIMSNETLSSLDGPLHGSFRNFLAPYIVTFYLSDVCQNH